MKVFKKMAAVLAAAAMAAGSFAAFGMTASAEGEIAQAYFIGQFGAETANWAPGDNSGVTTASVTGDAQYEVTWNLSNADGATETGDSWFLAVCISPTNGTENFTTDTFADLKVSLDEVYVNGKKLDYTVSSDAINTAYYENGPGVTRLYLHNDWVAPKITDLASGTIEGSIKAVFTVSGTGLTGTSNVGSTQGNTGSADESSNEEPADNNTQTDAPANNDTTATTAAANNNSSSNNSNSNSSNKSNSSSGSSTNNGTTSETGDVGIAAIVLGAIATAALGVGAVTAVKKKK